MYVARLFCLKDDLTRKTDLYQLIKVFKTINLSTLKLFRYNPLANHFKSETFLKVAN